MRKGILLFVLIPFLVSCMSIPSQRPAWIGRPYDGKYPEDKYLLVVGSGSSYQKAVENARINLASVFSSQVEAVTRITTIDSSEGGSFDALFEQGTVSSNVEDLVGSEVVSSFTDEMGQTYVRLAVERQESARFLQTRLAELTKELAKIRSQTSADRLERYRFLLSAYPVAQEADRSPIESVLTKEINPDHLGALALGTAHLARSISVEVIVQRNRSAFPERIRRGASESGFAHGGGDCALTVTMIRSRSFLKPAPTPTNAIS